MDSVVADKIASIFDRAKAEALILLREDEKLRAQSIPLAEAVNDDEGITAAEAAQMMNVNKWRVYEMVKQGLVPASHPSPRTVRIRRGTVKEFIRTGRCTTVEKKGGAKLLPLRRVR